MNEKNLTAKLSEIQLELKVTKEQHNSFGKYNYRSCEDIFAAIKPLLGKFGCAIFAKDKIELVGDRYYVCAEVTLSDGKEVITTQAYAREAQTKKGMDEAQITGAASSYARKYALAGMFALDDNKDIDSSEDTPQSDGKKRQLTPSDKEWWGRAVSRAKKDGVLDEIKKHAILSLDNEVLLKKEAGILFVD
jgi:hypothetical protein